VIFRTNLSSAISRFEKKYFNILSIYSSDKTVLLFVHNLKRELISSISSSFSKLFKLDVVIVDSQKDIKSLYNGKYLLVTPINESESLS
jgi:hypothetical protein